MESGRAYVGIDFGTSGARLVAIDDAGKVLADAKTPYSSSQPTERGPAWSSALFHLLSLLPEEVKARVAALAIDGTSATALLLDAATGDLLAPPELYNEAQPLPAVQRAKGPTDQRAALVQEMAPPDHTATASTSTLCKVLAWDGEGRWQAARAEGRTPAVLHQADWLASLLTGERRTTDWNNALKLGFDPAPGEERYPDWLTDQPFAEILPQAVCAPGAPLAPLTAEAAARTGLPRGCVVCAGTTDSIAAFLAAGVCEPGEAVTSLGSTLAIKLLSESRLDDARYGLYSHRLGDAWLVGGASNSGGAVLRQHFSDAQLAALTPALDPARPTGLDYYPLPAPGERFPVNDPAMQPRLSPRPASDAAFLQGMLEGIAAIEARAYGLLAQGGASALTRVVTAGGGAQNPAWTAIRQRELGVPVEASRQAEAAYGSALLARQGALLARQGAAHSPQYYN